MIALRPGLFFGLRKVSQVADKSLLAGYVNIIVCY
jgi:hypothetical protein